MLLRNAIDHPSTIGIKIFRLREQLTEYMSIIIIIIIITIIVIIMSIIILI